MLKTSFFRNCKDESKYRLVNINLRNPVWLLRQCIICIPHCTLGKDTFIKINDAVILLF